MEKSSAATAAVAVASQHVSFDMLSHRHTRPSPDEFGSTLDHLDKGRYHPRRFACCAWSCLIVFFFIIALLFVCITYLAFLKSTMPKVNVRTFNITKFQVDDGSQKMNAIIGLELMFSNMNGRFKLLYGLLDVNVRSEDVLLGENKLSGFSQSPMNDTNLDMTMTMENADVSKYAADDLKSDMNANEVVFDVFVGGHIGFEVGKLEMSNVPFLTSCHQIKRTDVDNGRRPECSVKMFGIR
ncbi:hypothetical protein Fmac_014303 [Flemingia macrophylla]|uniref:Late embryogenesis abundant protein LEA-2 subgroup domain-containing protein n=1 Tax=Flemingia macrophylla TaxID=520843 RepID=A0ABD1MBE4_9FABA